MFESLTMSITEGLYAMCTEGNNPQEGFDLVMAVRRAQRLIADEYFGGKLEPLLVQLQIDFADSFIIGSSRNGGRDIFAA